MEEVFNEVYVKFKLNFYRGIFERLQERESSLSASEAFAVEVIHALDGPTISRFAKFLNVSPPNANYKINTLINKGYIRKEKSEADGREYILRTTPNFTQYYAINSNYVSVIMKRIRERFSEEETARFEEMLRVISQELMPENSGSLWRA